VSSPFRGDRQLRLEDGVVARGHDLRIERHPDGHVSERLRHERQHVWIVVAEVVAPPERVVDTASVARWISAIAPWVRVKPLKSRGSTRSSSWSSVPAG